MLVWLSWVCLGAVAAGCIYALWSAIAVRGFAGRPSSPAPERFPSIAVVKPLRGAEPRLYQALASFCMQDYPGPVQILFGASRADDACVPVVRKLIADFPARDLELIIDDQAHGANGKVSNLINVALRIRHDLVVVSDSDIRVQRDYLRGVAGGFAKSGIGLVTCLYRGEPAAGVWSRLSAMAIDYHFLPSVLVGLRLHLAHPCLGSTIALMRDTLPRIGGFVAFADQLADDYAIGAAVRRIGMEIAVAAPVVTHLCCERTARELARHELRWARTIRAIDPKGFAGSVVTHPIPFALLFAALSGYDPAGWLALTLALGSRLALVREIDRAFPGESHSRWLLPVRDLLSFLIFAASFFVAVVSWRGQRYRVRADGTLSRLNETAL
jgi:ceramide glucosyltransferase